MAPFTFFDKMSDVFSSEQTKITSRNLGSEEQRSFRKWCLTEMWRVLLLLLLALLGAAGVWWLGSWLYSAGTGRAAAAAVEVAGRWWCLGRLAANQLRTCA